MPRNDTGQQIRFAVGFLQSFTRKVNEKCVLCKIEPVETLAARG